MPTSLLLKHLITLVINIGIHSLAFLSLFFFFCNCVEMHVTHAFQRQGHYLCEQHMPSSPINILLFSISISLLFHGPLHHLSQIYLQHCSVASLWPCLRIEKRQGIITCHLTDNGIPWSFHPFTFQGFVYKTTVGPVLCIFSPCIMGLSADVCFRNVSSYQFKVNMVETGVWLS